MPWFDFERAKNLPVYILHGALDWMAPVAFARQARDTLEQHNYRVVYHEISDWGHAMPFSKVEDICAFFNQILQERHSE
jgi:predicted esterase